METFIWGWVLKSTIINFSGMNWMKTVLFYSGKTMPFAPSPSHHHFYRWYGYQTSRRGPVSFWRPTESATILVSKSLISQFCYFFSSGNINLSCLVPSNLQSQSWSDGKIYRKHSNSSCNTGNLQLVPRQNMFYWLTRTPLHYCCSNPHV